MATVNVHEAKTHLSRMLERVAAGEEIVIAKNGKPVAKLVPFADKPRRPGRLKTQLIVRPDFDDELPDAIQRGFGGRGPE